MTGSRLRRKEGKDKKERILINTKKFGTRFLYLERTRRPEVTIPRTCFHEGEALYGMDKYDEASKAYDKILSKSKGSSIFDSALYSSAFCFEQEGQHEKAVGAFLEYFKTGKIKDKRKEACITRY
jgi:tetratricopeptide (TPR) repeat protein